MKISYIIIWSVMLLSFSLMGCHTGIESTKTITMSKDDRRQLEATPEEKLMADLQAPLLSEWQRGKKFLVSDDRALMVFDASTLNPDDDKLKGRYIEFAGVALKTNPGGIDEAVVVFKDGDSSLQYSTGKSLDEANRRISSMDIPMLIDLELVDNVRNVLAGRKVWTRSQLWYDRSDNRVDGRKFVPVVIDDVRPGTVVFPFRVYITDENGNQAMLFMNAASAGMESRTFQNLFSLTDPKNRYPSIHDDVWKLIQHGKVKLGMTKEECKLSLGNPSDVNSGHDWNSTIDLWQYPNGAFLRFQDGLLIGFHN